MRWLKRLLHIFYDRNEQVDDDVYSSEIGNTEQKNERHMREKDVEGRVLYHYPKGQFRFPMIPDRAEKQVEISTERKVEHSEEKQHQVKNKQSRPFHPTKLPPSFYGIGQTEEQVPIEYELSGFLTEKNEVVEVDEDILQIDMNKSETNIKVQTVNEQKVEPTEPSEEKITKVRRESVLQVSEQSSSDDEDTNKIISVDVHESNSERKQEASVAINDRQEDRQEDHKNNKTESSPKKHIPFNVVMLKEDKRKLAERKKRELLQKTKLDRPLELADDKNKRTEKILQQSELREVEVIRSENQAVQTKDEENSASVQQDQSTQSAPLVHYEFPSIQLLSPPVKETDERQWMEEQTELLDATLKNFHVGAKVVNVTKGPSVTRFEIQPELGVKVNKVTNLADDIKLSLAARDIRIEAPIPGKHTIGIEVPNKVSRPVLISEIILSETFRNDTSPLSVALGLDISGQPVITDLRKMPHGLIAGATGSGKSVCINTMLISLLYKATPDELKLLLIDPKMVELAPYNRIPHLISPVITDVKAATAALKWAVDEMERRYQLFAHEGVRDIARFNEDADKQGRLADKLPYIVIIIDELADLMMMSPADVEEAICRIAQKARACGIHLIIATQRPSVDVITGLIKANIPTRIAFSVSSQVDSRTIIDISGAERLLGRGDMLFLENGSGKPVRLQGTFVSDDEIDDVVAFVREQQEPNYLFEQEELLKQSQMTEEDELFYDACEFIVEQGSASTSSLQRQFRIGYNRAARLIDMLEQQGFISEARGSRPRDVLISETDLEAMQ